MSILSGAVGNDIEFLTSLDHSVEVSDECSVILFKGGDVASTEALPSLDGL